MKIGQNEALHSFTHTNPVTPSAQAGQEFKAQSLEAFKQDVYAQIDAILQHPSQRSASTAINITDKAFEKMMADPAKKEEVLGLIKRELSGNYGMASPSYVVLNFDDECVYSGTAAGSAYGSWFSQASANSFWKNKPANDRPDDTATQRRRERQRTDLQLQQTRMATRAWQDAAAAQDAEQMLGAATDTRMFLM